MSPSEIIDELRKAEIVPVLEGDQIRLTGNLHKMTNDLLVIIRARKSELAAFMQGAAGHHADGPIGLVPIQDLYRASNAQKRIWLLCQLEGMESSYNIVTGLHLSGALKQTLMRHALSLLVRKHESLRTTFEDMEGELMQRVHSDMVVGIEFHDIRGMADMTSGLKTALEEMSEQVMLPADGPLFRIAVYEWQHPEHKATESAVLLCMHHIISDGWSVALFFKELFQLYDRLDQDIAAVPEKMRLQYKDYTYWQYDRIASAKGAVAASYWKEKLAAAPQPLTVPLDFDRPAGRATEGEAVRYYLPEELHQSMQDCCRHNGVTFFNFVRAALTILLNRYSGQDDVIIGTPVSGRYVSQLEDQQGLYVNTLPLRIKVLQDIPFRTFLANVSRDSQESFRYHDYPFDMIIDNPDIQREAGRNPLFDIMLVLQDAITIDENSRLADMSATTLEYYLHRQGIGKRKVRAKFDLVFNMGREADGSGYLEIEYASRLYKEDTVRRLFASFLRIAGQVIADQQILIGKIDVLPPSEREMQLYGFNGYMGPYAVFDTVVEMLEKQVLLSPEAPALLCGDISLSYRELNEQSNRLAWYLQDRHGICRGDLAGIYLERGVSLIVSVLAVLKCGCAYVPLDPDYPADRIAYMVQDSGCRLVLDEKVLSDFEAVAARYSPLNMEIPIGQDDLIYVIYTSGSTGEPKGAMVSHGAFSNLVCWYRQLLELDSRDGVLLMAPVSFDLAQKNIFVPIICGARLVITTALYGDYGELAATIGRHGVTVVNAAPSAFYPLLDPGVNDHYRHLSPLRHIILGGEPIRSREFRGWQSSGSYHARVINSYGPTECTDVVSWHVLDDRDWSSGRTAPIGLPIPNTSLYILDDGGGPVPFGVPGEICISGICVGKGYLGQGQQTQDRFVANPYAAGHLLYKTGDMGRRRDDGRIEYLGRRDAQVKIRGYRIETGEIERAMDSHPGIEQSVVVSRLRDGEPALYGYFQGDATLTAATLHQYLSVLLPVYMLPVQYVRVASFPQTPSGKTDRKRLSEMELAPIASGIRYEAARNEMEVRLVAIWEELLGVRGIGIQDDFFVLGGHSLKVTQLGSRIYREFNVKLSMDTLFMHSVLQQQSGLIAAGLRTAYMEIPAAAEQQDYPLSSSQRRLWVLSQLSGSNEAYNMFGCYVLEGDLDRSALSVSLGRVMARHESLRTVFEEDGAGSVRQRILPVTDEGLEIRETDLIGHEHELEGLLEEEALEGFDLSVWPLVRCRLFRLSDRRVVFSVVMHHIISDGWSLELLIQELQHCYNAVVSGEAPSLRPLRIHYKDYAVWQQQQLSGDAMRISADYWLSQFTGEIPVLELPSDHVRPVRRSYRGGMVESLLPAAQVSGLEALCLEQGATLFMGLVALVNTLLYHYTGQEDIVIGSPVAGRDHIDLEDQVGFYVNTVALRTRFDAAAGFRSLLEIVKTTTLGAYEHQQYPFDELVDKLPLPRDLSRHPLFDVMVVLQNMREAGDRFTGEGLTGLRVSAYEGALPRNNKFDLLFDCMQVREGVQIRLSYNSDLFLPDTVMRMASHLIHLLQEIVTAPSIPICEQDYLTATEKDQLLRVFNSTATDFPDDISMIGLFRQQAAAAPDRPAVRCGNIELSYQELDEASEKLCHYLMRLGVGQQELVGVMMDRSAYATIAILGILKAGAAYVPVEPGNPAKRKQFIFSDTGINVLLTTTEYREDHGTFEGTVLYLDEPSLLKAVPISDERRQVRPDDRAYVIYTSGSTGEPKGVVIPHRALVDYFYGIISKTNIRECRSFGMVSTIAADLGNTVFYTSLFIGGTLHIFTEEEISVSEYIINAGLDCLKIVPSHWKALQKDGKPVVPHKCLIFGGEQLTPDIIEHIRETGTDCQIYNHYGPSETTIGKLLTRVLPEEAKQVIPLGKPFCNASVYILHKNKTLLPVGVAGEICIGGSGLADGYLNRDILTEEKFVNNPYRPGEKIYRTADLGKWLPDGNMVFLGRKDFQVKVRGYRVEPGEIEKLLKAHPAVNAAVVMPWKNSMGEYDLVAYVSLKEEMGWGELRSYLSDRLPVYMLPAYYITLDALPLTGNGKVDRSRLPSPSGTAATTFAYVAPRHDTDVRLIALWEEVLERQGIGIANDFFELGGHSLKAIRLLGLIHKVFNVRIRLQDIFNRPLLQEQANFVLSAVNSRYVSVPLAAATPWGYPLSSSQRRLWVLSRFREGNTAYNMPGTYVFEGRLDITMLQWSFDQLISRHEILRTVFREDGEGNVWQQVQENSSFQIRYEDLRSCEGKEAMLREMAVRDVHTVFDLSEGPLLQASLYQVDDDRYVFSYVMHHIISDGWSLGVLLKELLGVYHSGKAIDDILALQYKDYATWQQEQLRSGALAEDKAYWLQQLSGPLPVLELPSEQPRPAVMRYEGNNIVCTIDEPVVKALKQMAAEEDCTLFMALAAVLKVLLYRYSGQEDIIIGSPVAGRDQVELQGQIGFYVNMIALRNRTSGSDNFRDLLRRMRQVALDAYEHQAYPFDELVDDLLLQRDTSRHPLFDVLIVLQNMRAENIKEQIKLDGINVYEYQAQLPVTSKFDLTFSFEASGEGLHMRIEYNSHIYGADFMRRMSEHFVALMRRIPQHTGDISSLHYLPPSEREMQLYGFNGYMGPYAVFDTVVEMLEKQVLLSPEAPALLCGDISLSYRELNEQSNRLAWYLQDRHGICRRDLAGIYLERGVSLIVSVLAVLKCGCAYVPLDPDYPADRIAYMVQDSGCRLVLDEKVLSDFEAVAARYSPLNMEIPIGQDDLIYVIYTSGSTGEPKGAMVSHGAFSNLVCWYRQLLELDSRDGVLLMAPVSFDLAQKNIFVPIICGARLVITTALYGDYGELAATIGRHGVTVVNAAPSAFYPLLDPGVNDHYRHLSPLRHIILGGEPIRSREFRGWQSSGSYHARVINSYGPTECTDVVSWHVLDDRDWSSGRTAPIGLPIPNTSLYILDDGGGPVPFGVPGEICISGICVGKGYLGQGRQTQDRFVANPYAAGHLLYKTGDMGRRRDDGRIEYLGRRDAQVKIRGYRIETGEIERAMDSHPGIEQSVVVSRLRDGEPALYGYFQGDATLTAATLHQYLSVLLPVYMLPVQYVRVASFPQTPSGKTDRKRLSEMELAPIASGIRYEAARNEMEVRLVAIWEELLGVRGIGIQDDFFVLGGHSLKVTQLGSRIYREFNVKLSMDTLFMHSVLQQQSGLIAAGLRTAYMEIPAAAEQQDYPLSSSQRRLWVLSQLSGSNEAYNMFGCYVLEGDLDRSALSVSLGRVMARHESLRTVFEEDGAGSVRQRILPVTDEGLEIRETDLIGHEHELEGLLEEEALEGFDLSVWPLVRCRLFRLSDRRVVFSVVMHHIISDGWSLELLIQELQHCYNAAVSGEAPSLRPLRIHYKDYAVWQQQQLSGDAMRISADYWLSQFAGEIPVLELPSDHVRPVRRSYRGGMVESLLPAAQVSGLEALCLEQGATLFMGLVALVNTLLYHYTGQEDIVIGSPVAGRDHIDLEDQVGFYVNTVALRTRFDAAAGFRSLLEIVKTTTLGAYEHQQYPFDELVDKLPLPRDLSRHPLFDVMVVLQNMREAGDRFTGEGLTGLRVSAYEGALPRNNKFDLLFDCMQTSAGVLIKLSYNNEVLSAGMPIRMMDNLVRLADAVVKSPDTGIGRVDVLSDNEKHTLLTAFNRTATSFSSDKTIDALFEEQVRKSPDNIAVNFYGVCYTYAQLDMSSNQLAHFLRKQADIRPDTIIGIRLERSDRFIVAILGILKAGAAYMPVDPHYPAGRIAFMEADSQCLLTIDELLYDTFLSEKETYPATPVEKMTAGNNLVYLIYTSGSTGTPKGIMMKHSAMANLMDFHIRQFREEDVRAVLQCASTSFDVSFQEVFSTLLRGAALFPVNEEDKKDQLGLTDFIAGNHIDTVFLPTAYFKLLMDNNYFVERITGCVKNLIVAGEQLTVSDYFLDHLKKGGIQLHNHYGPAETHVVTACRIGRGYESELRRIPSIGRPVDNNRIYVLNKQLALAPLGAVGEICIAGRGLAKGYLNRAETEAERFIADPYRNGERMYRTGDLGRWCEDGNIYYMGRRDFQIKVRGYRVEPGEIESQLKNHAAVSAAAVIPWKNDRGESELAAYFCLKGEVEQHAIRSYLSSQLPAYMLPAYYITLDALPLTGNGKVDRSRLPSPSGTAATTFAYVAPRHDTDVRLIALWEEVLERQGIGIANDFFELGGHSLKAIRLLGLIHKVFNVRIRLQDIFNRPLLQEQANFVLSAVNSRYVSVPLAAATPWGYPLSSSQRRLWVLSRFREGNTAYNMPGTYVFEGRLDITMLQWSFDQLISRHEILRTVFREDGEGNVWQQVQENSSFQIRYEDLRGCEGKEAMLREMAVRDVHTVFDLSEGPLLQASLYQVDDDRYVFSYVMHHIISDGWSLGVLLKELLGVYHSGKAIDDILPLQYKDYATWQQEQLRSGALAEDKAYWLQQLSGSLPVLELPSDYPRPAIKGYQGGNISLEIDGQLITALKQLAAQENCTLFMALVAVVNVLLFRYTGQEDIIIGSPVAGRDHPALENQLGCYLNMIVLRGRLSGSNSYRELLRHIRQVALDAYEHQAYPFDELVDELRLQRDLGRHPVFDVQVNLIDETTGMIDDYHTPAMQITRYQQASLAVSKFDLSFNFLIKDDLLLMQMEYSSELFTAGSMYRMATNFRQLMSAILHYPGKPVGQLDMLTDKEKQQLIICSQGADCGSREYETIHRLFERQAEKNANYTALIYQEHQYDFSGLNKLANQLAHCLVLDYGVVSGDVVGICLPRTEWMIVAMLAVLKAGGAYLPVDLRYPQQRIDYMLTDSGCKTLINEAMLAHVIPSLDNYSAENLQNANNSGTLAYVIYTSGSTGQPKGVMIEHRNAVSFFENIAGVLGLIPRHVMAATTNFTFDISVLETLGVLVNGITVNLYSGDEQEDLLSYLERNHITALQLTPSRFNQLLELSHGNLSVLEKIDLLLIGGEPLGQRNYNLLREMRTTRTINMYGPTETTIWSSCLVIKDSDRLSIGRPLPEESLYILDKAGQLVPFGVTGEIHIGGAGVGRGYLNNDRLTKEKFVPDPFHAGGRLYKTGDLGLWRPDGTIEFLGRTDDQLKISGFRIEAGEITFALMKHPAVTGAFVTGWDNASGEKDLVAYVSLREQVSSSVLRAYLAGTLPSYMVPGYFIVIDEWPLTPSGKIDRHQLPLPAGGMAAEAVVVPPATERELLLAGIWQDVLGRQHISMHDHFFDLGGNSLKATRLLLKINKTFQVGLSLKDIFICSVMKEQMAAIDQARRSGQEIPPAPPADSYPLSFSQQGIYLASQFDAASIAYNMAGIYQLEGDLDTDAIAYAFAAIIERHQVLQTTFREDKDGTVRQYISLPPVQDRIPLMKDLRNTEEVTAVQQLLDKDISTPFSLSDGPLLRASLYRIHDRQWIFCYCMHHIISDAWSMKIWTTELFQLYRQYYGENILPLKPLPVQYKDYAVWQQASLAAGALNEQRRYWLNTLGEELPASALRPDKAQYLEKSYRGALIKRTMEATAVNALLQLCRSQDATLFMGLLSLIDVLLYQYSRQDDIIVGTSVSGRQHPDLEDQIGCYLNLLPLRVQLDSQESFESLLTRVAGITRAAFAHQDYPFEQLLEDLNEQGRGNKRVFDVLLVLKSYAFDEVLGLAPEGIIITDYISDRQQTSKFDCSFIFFEDNGTLQLQLEYNSDLFHAATMEALASRLEILLDVLVRQAGEPIYILTEADSTHSSASPTMDSASFVSEIDTDF